MNFPYFDILLKIALFWIIAVISPGPNFLLTLNTSLQCGKTKALFVVMGIINGTAIWSISGFLGINLLFFLAPWLYNSIKIIGVFYLFLFFGIH